jgi:hypothetical protein
VLNFTDLSQQLTASKPVQEHRAEVPVVQEQVTVTPLPTPAPQPETKAGIPSFHVPPLASSLEWEKLRDYVVEQIEAIHGPFPREPRRENTTFMAFYGRWEELALPIAKHAFEQAGGMWLGAPVSVARFEKSSDTVFAMKIAGQL